jgi:3-methylfumaryl-CoA hydratase
MAATLDRTVPLVVPPLWHWLYFLPMAAASAIGPDGHPERGGFLPPVALPRRMWAGGRLIFHSPLHAGKPATKTSTIESVEDKTGRTGRLVFVTVSHKITSGSETCIEEEHDIVYRAPPTPGASDKAGALAPAGEVWQRSFRADPVLLFRYSALTFNGHRIHYDHPYVTEVEGYPGLIVHGPLIATLLADLITRNAPDAVLKEFSFRALRPLFANNEFTLCGTPSEDGKSVALWAKDHDGFLAMQATATLA